MKEENVEVKSIRNSKNSEEIIRTVVLKKTNAVLQKEKKKLVKD